MSPILNLQRQMRELGRIRTGNQVVSGSGKRHPAKLDTFRITSESKELIEAAAAAYGGVVTPWANPGGGPEFEVITTAASLDIIVPPGQPVSQWYEMWSGGGCQRRCDGVTMVLTMEGCMCPQDVEERLALAAKGEACKATTRLNVMLPALPDLGVWRLESHGYYAAVELMGAAEILAMATARGKLIPARLRLEQRSKKEPGKPTKMFAVPIIEFVETRMLELGLTGPAPERIGAGDRPAVPALPAGDLPATSDFRAPMTAATPAYALEDAAADDAEREANRTGDPDDVPTTASDAPGPDLDPAVVFSGAPVVEPAATVAPAPQAAPDEVPRMTRETLLAKLEEAGISFEYAVERSKLMWPERGPGKVLDEVQLAALWADLSKEAAAAAL